MCDHEHFEFSELMTLGYINIDEDGTVLSMSKRIEVCNRMLYITPEKTGAERYKYE